MFSNLERSMKLKQQIQMFLKTTQGSSITQPKTIGWRIRLVSYVLFVLIGQSAAMLLGRLYYDKGGKHIFLAAVLATIGFPVLIPVALYLSWAKHHSDGIINGETNSPSTLMIVVFYIFLGILQAGSNMLYAIGLLYLPVSTFSILSASQLAFLAFFSFFLNRQKLTLPIINSLVLLTLSSVLLVSQNDDSKNSLKVSKQKQVLGISCTLIASALFSLNFSLTQLFMNKILKTKTITSAFNMIIYQSLAASSFVTVVLFASGEWKNLRSEIENFELGKALYITILVSIAVCWQFFSIGAVGMIFEVSSLFSNIVGTLGLPIVPVLSAIIFRDKMDFMKVVSIFLAVWGFASYAYHHYLEDHKLKQDDNNRAQDASSAKCSGNFYI